jgi:hypothetical protein
MPASLLSLPFWAGSRSRKFRPEAGVPIFERKSQKIDAKRMFRVVQESIALKAFRGLVKAALAATFPSDCAEPPASPAIRACSADDWPSGQSAACAWDRRGAYLLQPGRFIRGMRLVFTRETGTLTGEPSLQRLPLERAESRARLNLRLPKAPLERVEPFLEPSRNVVAKHPAEVRPSRIVPDTAS